MALSTLKGAGWQIKASGVSYSNVSAVVKFKSNSATYAGIIILTGPVVSYIDEYDMDVEVYNYQSGWVSDNYRNVTFIDGADIADSALIGWVENNGTQTAFGESMTSPNGVHLALSGSAFDKDINVIPSLEEKSISPSTSSQTVTPGSGYAGIKKATVSAVTAAIDNNIVSGNIKKDVTILGVTGSYEGGGGGVNPNITLFKFILQEV